jgi:predicted ATPase
LAKPEELYRAAVNPRIQVRLQNFRLFKDTGWITLEPLTCVVGRNSSGKSSFVFALLLLKQSIEKRVFGSVITPLSLKGDYCDLGQFRDLARDHDDTRAITYSFKVPIVLIDNYQSDAKGSGALVELAPSRPVFSGWMEYVASELTRIRDREVEVNLTFSEDETFGPSLSSCKIAVPGLGRVKFLRTISGERKTHWRTYATGNRWLGELALEQTSPGFFPQLTFRRKPRRLSQGRPEKRTTQFVRAGQFCFEFLEDLLRGSEMIGPFRQPPERRYTFGGFGTSKIGPSGEQAVDLLVTELLVKKGGAKPLISAVGYWLKALKLANSLKVRDAARRVNLFEIDLRLTRGRQLNNLVDVGFGISQVLPVIVQGLLMRRGGIYIVQEPEIHLHPDAQAGLADFFIYLTSQGVTCIVETHSEYLLLRLRRRLAEGKGPIRSALPKLVGPSKRLTEKDVAILISENSGTEAKIYKLGIGKGFQLEKMPPGFMSQATEDRMELLRAVTKRNG